MNFFEDIETGVLLHDRVHLSTAPLDSKSGIGRSHTDGEGTIEDDDNERKDHARRRLNGE